MSENANEGAQSTLIEQSTLTQVLADLSACKRVNLVKDIDNDFLDSVRHIEGQLAVVPTGLILNSNSEMERLTFLDNVTELYNCKTFLKELKNAIKRANRYDKPLAIGVIAIDGWEELIAKYGRLTGDAILRVVGKVIRESISGADIPARYTDEQLAVIFTDIDCASAAVVGEQIRQKIGIQSIMHNWQQLKLTVSVGVASYQFQDCDTLIATALHAVRLSQKQGGDRVCIT